jgi:hypothetical protein
MAEREKNFFGEGEEAGRVVRGGKGGLYKRGPKGWESQRVRALGGRGGRWRERLFFRRGAVSAPGWQGRRRAGA